MRLVSSRFGSSSFLSGPRGLAVAGAAGFVLVPVLAGASWPARVARSAGVWRFLILSIALFSFAYGLKGGVAAGCRGVRVG